MKRLIALIAALAIVVGGAVFLFRHAAPQSVGTAATSTASTSTPGGVTSIPEEGEVTLSLGQAAAFKGFIVTPTAVVEDSRCPAGVYCIQAGTVRVKLMVSSAFGTTTRTVSLGNSIDTGSQVITFVSVAPLKTASSTIRQSDYKFTVKVEKRASNGTLAGCYIGGCSGEVCSDDPNAVSSCLYKSAYACYKTARCERQATGQCGWTPDPALDACLQNAK